MREPQPQIEKLFNTLPLPDNFERKFPNFRTEVMDYINRNQWPTSPPAYAANSFYKAAHSFIWKGYQDGEFGQIGEGEVGRDARIAYDNMWKEVDKLRVQQANKLLDESN